MDLSGNYDTKRWGCSLFIVSVLVWLITITAVFQVTINHTAGNMGITYFSFIDHFFISHVYSIIFIILLFVITENVSGNDNSLMTVSDEMNKLEGGLGPPVPVAGD